MDTEAVIKRFVSTLSNSECAEWEKKVPEYRSYLDSFDHALAARTAARTPTRKPHTKTNHEVTMRDLLDGGYLKVTRLKLVRDLAADPAELTGDGSIWVGGKSYPSPSAAACAALNIESANGWIEWQTCAPYRIPRTLSELRNRFKRDHHLGEYAV